jgi:hypothetical protein
LPVAGHNVKIVVNIQIIDSIIRTYAEGKGPKALFGSSGYLEI